MSQGVEKMTVGREDWHTLCWLSFSGLSLPWSSSYSGNFLSPPFSSLLFAPSLVALPIHLPPSFFEPFSCQWFKLPFTHRPRSLRGSPNGKPPLRDNGEVSHMRCSQLWKFLQYCLLRGSNKEQKFSGFWIFHDIMCLQKFFEACCILRQAIWKYLLH